MRSMVFCAAVLAAVVVTYPAAAQTEGGTVIADYVDDFTTSGPAHPGWSYLWNASGPIRNAAGTQYLPGGFQPLVRDVNPLGWWETQANSAYPDAPPGFRLAATNVSLIPGQGSAQAADGIERYVIAAYTVSAADIAAAGGANQAWLDAYRFAVAPTALDGINAAIFVNTNPVIAISLPGGIVYDRSFPDAYPVPLGTVSAGDTIYVAIGAGATESIDDLGIDYSIILVPEPASMSMLALAAGALLVRRRT